MGIKESFLKSCGEVKESAKKLGNEIKLERKLNILNDELDELYKTLGRIRFAQLESVLDADEESKKIIDEIKRVNDEITSLRSARAKKCAICGKALDNNNEFCPYCGTKQ